MNPRDLEAQVLAAVLVYGHRALQKAPDLSADDFTGPQRTAFAVCCRLLDDDLPAGIADVYAEFPDQPAIQSVVASLPDGPLVEQLPAMVNRLHSYRALRLVARAAAEATALAAAANGNVLEAVERAMELGRQIVEAAATHGRGDMLMALSEVGAARIADIGRLRRGEEIEQGDPVQFGIPELDRLLNVRPGQFLVIGGDTSSGKSSLCGQLATAEAEAGHPVVFITAEMSQGEMHARVASQRSGIPIHRLIDVRAAADENADEEYRRMASLPIYFQRRFPPRIEDAVAAIRQGVVRHGAKLAILDYAQRLASLDEENQERANARIAAAAKDLALSLGIVVVAAAQLNRQASGRKDARPTLPDLRASGRYEQDADAVVFVYQPSRYAKSGSPELIVAKQRNGPTGIVEVGFDPPRCRFYGIRAAA